ncbi:MAG: hypothetical protein IKA41_07745 [Bacteroidaceae bacterium]|nr:hypothetical protein [Bacteroidaceae bacterium]
MPKKKLSETETVETNEAVAEEATVVPSVDEVEKEAPASTEANPTVAEQPAQEKERAKAPQKPRQPRYQNEVTLKGTIAKVVAAKKVTAITLCTRAAVTVSNYPTVMFFGENGPKAAAFKEGERVVIKGTLQSYDEAKLRKGQSAVLTTGLSIEYDRTEEDNETTEELELRPIETACRQDENTFEVRGQILAIESSKRGETTITIRTIVGGRWSIIKYPYYARNTDYFLKNIYVHQFVRGVGTIQTANVVVDAEATAPTIGATDTRGRQPRLRTKKVQMYVLFDLYPISNR